MTYRAIFIPADVSESLREIEFDDFMELGGIISGTREFTMVERVSTQSLQKVYPNLTPGRYPQVNLWVDEEGLLKQLTYNPRATLFYPGGWLVGNAVITGEDLVKSEDGFMEPDLSTLPESVTVKSVQEAMDHIIQKQLEATDHS